MTRGRKIVNSQGTSVQLYEDTMERRLIIKIFFTFVSYNFLIIETDFSIQAPHIDNNDVKYHGKDRFKMFIIFYLKYDDFKNKLSTKNFSKSFLF